MLIWLKIERENDAAVSLALWRCVAGIEITQKARDQVSGHGSHTRNSCNPNTATTATLGPPQISSPLGLVRIVSFLLVSNFFLFSGLILFVFSVLPVVSASSLLWRFRFFNFCFSIVN